MRPGPIGERDPSRDSEPRGDGVGRRRSRRGSRLHRAPARPAETPEPAGRASGRGECRSPPFRPPPSPGVCILSVGRREPGRGRRFGFARRVVVRRLMVLEARDSGLVVVLSTFDSTVLS